MHFVSELLADKGRQIFAVHPNSTVLEAIREMDRHGIGALLVIDSDELVGIVSERDYARRGILQGRRSDVTKVGEIMTTELVTADLHGTIDECMQQMTDRRVRHLPVLEEGKVVGLVSIGDLVRVILARQATTIEQLSSYIKG
ncbi:MAG: CBS domain-containing protein [Planctomycetota bacterium]|nr:CBS domain-containing protein [Planctomycetota bacterium]